MTYPAGSPSVKVTGRRVVATILDGIVFGIVSSIFTALFGTQTSSSGMNLTRLSTGGSALLFVLVVLYYVLMEGLTGRTVGKMVTGIRVVDEATGGTPGMGKALLRTVLRLIDGIFGYLVAFIVVLASDRRRRLGDMAAKTLVVRA
ncbi:MAG: hypothetical protein QOH97_2600 [Actinoplanes sp.]|jgi:uncharacterized RDD family membrane protein YckC|nr:hypothetical protein [Actinoplanes sp.]